MGAHGPSSVLARGLSSLQAAVNGDWLVSELLLARHNQPRWQKGPKNKEHK